MLGEGRAFREKAEKTCQGQVGKGLASGGKEPGAATVAQVRGAQPGCAMWTGLRQWLSAVAAPGNGSGSLKSVAGTTEPEFWLNWSEVWWVALGFAQISPF